MTLLYKKRPCLSLCLSAMFLLAFFLMAFDGIAQEKQNDKKQNSESYWQIITEHADWSARAGLQVVRVKNKLYLMGGRTPIESDIFGDSEIWSDVWKSSLKGKKWRNILESGGENHWPARAYFQAVSKGKYMYVMGGQNFNVIPNPNPFPQEGEPAFISVSEFFNDVWRSRDGVHWKQMTDEAPWDKRAGLSCVIHRNELYVMAGSVNDDAAVIEGQPKRIYYNDVWKSKDGRKWIKVCDSAPWTPRAGAITVTKNGYIYLIGGEDNFTCEEDGRCPPYYNDVWRSKNGKHWELVTAEASWAARPGHQVVVYKNQFVLFGGFGLSFDPSDPFKPSNPMDIWTSKNGKDWKILEGAPWNAETAADIKYDFDAIWVPGKRKGSPPAILTFGGDRETFNPFDPFNYLNVDNDVWRFTPFHKPKTWDDKNDKWDKDDDGTKMEFKAYPSPFKHMTTIKYYLDEKDEEVIINIYNSDGRLVKHLYNGKADQGWLIKQWDGKNDKNQRLHKGIYYVKIITNKKIRTLRIVKK